jgi:hypothetical protein
MKFFEFPEINLAPVKYAHVHCESGGPIQRISARKVSIFGKPHFETYAYLKDSLRPATGNSKLLYGKADGTAALKNGINVRKKRRASFSYRNEYGHILNH